MVFCVLREWYSECYLGGMHMLVRPCSDTLLKGCVRYIQVHEAKIGRFDHVHEVLHRYHGRQHGDTRLVSMVRWYSDMVTWSVQHVMSLYCPWLTGATCRVRGIMPMVRQFS